MADKCKKMEVQGGTQPPEPPGQSNEDLIKAGAVTVGAILVAKMIWGD